MKKIKKLLLKCIDWAKPYFTWKMLPCLILAWIITNGWAYIFIILGSKLGINWMTIAGTTWATILWMPWTLEKPLVTIPLSLLFYRLIYRKKFVKKEVDKNDN